MIWIKDKEWSSLKRNKEDANKALLNFEDMKRKILKDYAKKNSKEFGGGLSSHSSHNRNGINMIPGYLSQLEDISKKGDLLGDAKSGNLKEDQQYTSESLSAKKKSGHKSNLK